MEKKPQLLKLTNPEEINIPEIEKEIKETELKDCKKIEFLEHEVLQPLIAAEVIETEQKLLRMGWSGDKKMQDYFIAADIGSYLCGDGSPVGQFTIYKGIKFPRLAQKNIQGLLTPKGTKSLREAVEITYITPPVALIELADELVALHSEFIKKVSQEDEKLTTLQNLQEKYQENKERVKSLKIEPTDFLYSKIIDLAGSGDFFWSRAKELKKNGEIQLINLSSYIAMEFHKVVVTKPKLAPVVEEHVTKMSQGLRKFAKLVYHLYSE